MYRMAILVFYIITWVSSRLRLYRRTTSPLHSRQMNFVDVADYVTTYPTLVSSRSSPKPWGPEASQLQQTVPAEKGLPWMFAGKGLQRWVSEVVPT